jgi:hypothetical protein
MEGQGLRALQKRRFRAQKPPRVLTLSPSPQIALTS